ncbi:MAG TPA: acetyl-CoA C-acyltransferase, partial [Tepidisphaeraceae bacterium]|nr:acetyl-CoA C-acyltransferase [Tepidisphaeraceae bacterium]
SLREVHASELARVAMQEALYRAGCPAEALDEVILGNVVMPADAANLARVSAIWAGVPREVPGITLQRNCASGMEAVSEAAMRIRGGLGHLMLAGGAESMSNVPLLFPQETMVPMTKMARAKGAFQKASAVATLRPRHFKPIAALELGLSDPTCGMIMGKTAEVLVQEFGISRKEQDEFALQSHQKAVAAMKSGRFEEEIVPVYAGRKFDPVTQDNGPRENQTMEALAKLKPIFDRKDGSVTVGNSCQVTDGAAALLVADADWANAHGATPLGYVRAYAYAGLDPSRMGLGPVFAIDQLLKQTGLEIGDIPLFEINEAFAGQVLACLKAMASDDYCQKHLGRSKAIGEIDPQTLNVNGGAVALGHPVGATGARLVLTMLLEMKRRNVERGVAALCVGGGQGAAILLERS